MSRRKGYLSASRTSEENLINLMPLIDVIFVVLVMFILIAPMVNVDKVALAQSSPVTKQNLSSQEISIYVRADNSIWYHQKPVSLKELEALLEVEKRQRGLQVSPQLFHDKAASFGTYQEIKNLLEKIGFSEVDVILQS